MVQLVLEGEIVKTGIVLAIVVVIFLLINFLLDRGTKITYQNVSDSDAREFKQIEKLINGKPCDGPLINTGYVKRISEEFPQFYFSLKQEGLIVNGHYFVCLKEGENYLLRFVDPNNAP